LEILKYIRSLFWVFVFLFSLEGITQITDVDSAYQGLDYFREVPSPERATAFKHDLKEWNATSDYDQLAKVVAYCNLGHFEQQFLQFQDAISSYETAKMLYIKHELSGYDMISSCYIPLGNLYTQTNALGEAENEITAYILLAQQTNRKTVIADGLNYLSVVFQSQGAHSRAISALERGLKLMPNDDRLRLKLAYSLVHIGEVSRSESMVKHYLQRDPSNVKAHLLMAEIHLKKEQPEAALVSLKLATKNLLSNKSSSARDIAKAYLNMAELAVQLGADNNALLELYKVYGVFIPDFHAKNKMPSRNQLIAENTLIDALNLQALIYTRQGKLTIAYDAYKLAFEVSDKLDAASLLQGSKIIQSGATKIRSEKCLNLLFELYEAEKDTIWLHEAIQIDQRSKSPILLKERRLQAQLSASKETVLVGRIRQAQRNSSVLLRQLDAIKNRALLDVTQLESVQQKYNETTVSLRDLLKQFAPTFVANEETLSLRKLKAISLAKEETAMSYFIGKESIYQFIVSEGAVTFLKLANSIEGCDKLFESCSKLNSFFESPSRIINDPNSYVKHANGLYEMLAIPKVKKLVVIPDGLLSFLPLNALITEPTNTINFAEMPFLIRSTELSYGLSLKDFMNVSDSKQFEGSVLGVFPVFEGTNKALTYSVQEAEAIKDVVDATNLMRNEATVSAFLTAASSFDVIHISSHALGGTFTSPAGIEFSDRTLTIDELYGLQFNKDLVVLSACETGVGKIIRGEGAQSMARGFQYTGVQNTLFSLWKVNDFTTANLMENYYKQLSKTGSFNSALHRSQLDFLDNPKIENSKKSPYHWAAFVYYGNTQKAHKFSYNYLWFLLFIVPLLLLLFLRKMKSRS
jgi:thioredoxin-like negative regulator of GroEL